MMVSLVKLQNDYAGLQSSINLLAGRVASLESQNAHAHFESLQRHPNHHASWTLRRNEDYLTTSRGVNSPRRTYVNQVNPGVRYDTTLDAAKVSLPPLTNELGPDGNGGKAVGQFACSWSRPLWNIGDRVVVQYELMISQTMHDRVPDIGLNGRRTDAYKFVNLCRGTGAITYELRTWFLVDPVDTVIDVRGYNFGLGASSLEAISRDNLVGPSTVAAYDLHPGPDSNRPYNQNPPHPEQFRIRSHRWIRVTCEMERATQGTRFKMWMADNETDPKLVIASPSSPSLGFLTSAVDPIEAWFCQLDTSQETTYAMPQPERWCAFRNLAVLSNVNGESVLGGRPWVRL